MSITLIAAGTVGAALIAGGSYAVGSRVGSDDSRSSELELVDGLEEGAGFEMKPVSSGDDPGLYGSYKREKEKREALKDGMVRWHLIGSSFSKPKYVRPEKEQGGNVAKVKHEGETYLFPEEASVPSEEEGVPVVIHRKGEADPLNLRDSWDDAIDAAALTQYLETTVVSEEPSSSMFGDGLLGYDAMTVFRYGILGLVGIAILIETMGGGLY